MLVAGDCFVVVFVAVVVVVLFLGFASLPLLSHADASDDYDDGPSTGNLSFR